MDDKRWPGERLEITYLVEHSHFLGKQTQDELSVPRMASVIRTGNFRMKRKRIWLNSLRSCSSS
jgi:hypothetical protein